MSAKLAKKFIERPMLRLSPAFSLNDPFEINIPKSTLDQMKNYVKSARKKNFERSLNSFMFKHGIVSLSATKESILMWSHYAEEHKGFVVEIELEEGNEISALHAEPVPKHSDAAFSKVEYKEDRFLPFELTPETSERARKYYYETKYIDWRYEEEYRFILPFDSATVLLLKTTNSNYASIIEKLELTPSSTPFHEISLGSLWASWDLKSRTYEQYHEALLEVWLGSNTNEAIFLVELSYAAISHLYIGAQADAKEFDSYFKEFNFSDVGYFSMMRDSYQKVSQAKLDLDSFSVNFKQFEPPQ